MVVYRVPHAYLTDYAMVGQRQQVLSELKRKDIDFQEALEMAKLLAIQEGHRLLKNYNYAKDTEFLNQYAFAESIKEQRLIKRASSVALHIDRYI
jgi:hypothetical protein